MVASRFALEHAVTRHVRLDDRGNAGVLKRRAMSSADNPRRSPAP